MTSMYAEYVREKTNDHIIELSNGFATYRFINERQVYIIDIYIRPEFRRSGSAANLANDIVSVARARGCTELIGSVVPSAKGSTDSIKVLLAYGMTLLSSTNDLILFRKEI